VTSAWPQGETGLHWHHHWNTVDLREYVTVPLLAAGALALQFSVGSDKDSDWNTPILFDTEVRNALRSTAQAAARQRAISAMPCSSFRTMHPVVIDNLIFTWEFVSRRR
jgi:hypothetical protein